MGRRDQDLYIGTKYSIIGCYLHVINFDQPIPAYLDSLSSEIITPQNTGNQRSYIHILFFAADY